MGGFCSRSCGTRRFRWRSIQGRGNRRGVAIGRNVFQHENPAKMTQAIASIAHKDLSVEDAMKILK